MQCKLYIVKRKLCYIRPKHDSFRISNLPNPRQITSIWTKRPTLNRATSWRRLLRLFSPSNFEINTKSSLYFQHAYLLHIALCSNRPLVLGFWFFTKSSDGVGYLCIFCVLSNYHHCAYIRCSSRRGLDSLYWRI